jgi:hypothetical protein
MTTSSPVTAGAPIAGAPASPPAGVRSSAGRRFGEEIVRLHTRMTFRGLPDAIDGDPIVRLDGFGDGLTTIAVRESQLPARYLRGVMGFRLAQFLHMGWMDPEIAYRRGLYHEPLAPSAGPETIHALTLTAAGRIAGYIAYVGSPDAVGVPLDAPERGPFAAEVAHHVELLSGFAAPGRTSHDVYEVKRFVRDRFMERGPVSDRVAWHLLLGLGRCALELEVQVVCGDSRENGALRHLRLVGFDPLVIDGTRPSLPRDQLMWPSYEQPQLAKPFAATVPADFAGYMDAIESVLALECGPGWQRAAVGRFLALRGPEPEMAA